MSGAVFAWLCCVSAPCQHTPLHIPEVASCLTRVGCDGIVCCGWSGVALGQACTAIIRLTC